MASSPLHLFLLLPLRLLFLLPLLAAAKPVLENGYTVTTFADLNPLPASGPYPYAILPRLHAGDLLLLDSAGSALYTLSLSSSPGEPRRLARGKRGSGFDDGDAAFDRPRSVAVDAVDNVYVADQRHGAVRKVAPSGYTTTIAGGLSSGHGHRDGLAQNATFSADFELVYVPKICALLVTDRGNRMVRQINLKPEDCAHEKQSGGHSTSMEKDDKYTERSGGQFDTDVPMSKVPVTDSTFEEDFGTSSDSCQGAWSNLSKQVVSNLSESVVSLASFNGGELNCACTGMIVTYAQGFVNILTSADLLRSRHDSNNFSSSMRIKVYFPNGQEGRGFLRHYDLDYNVAYMQAKSFPGLQEVFLGPQLQIGPHSQVVAGFKSGKLLAAAGIVTDVPTEKYMTSTCKITRCGLGGPLVDFEGNFVGMNFYNSEGNTFLPRNKIQKMLECNLVHCILKSIHIQIQILSQIGIEASVGKYFIKHN